MFLLRDIPLSVSWYFLFFNFAFFFAGLFISGDVFRILLNFSQLGLRLLIVFLVFVSDDTSEDGAWGKDEGTSAWGDEAGWFSLTSPESRHRYMYFMMFKGQLTCAFCLGSSIAAQCFVLKTAQRSTAMLHGCCSTVYVLQEVNAKLDTAGTVYMVAAYQLL